jgi:hypothetical protein
MRPPTGATSQHNSAEPSQATWLQIVAHFSFLICELGQIPPHGFLRVLSTVKQLTDLPSIQNKKLKQPHMTSSLCKRKGTKGKCLEYGKL